VDWDEVWPLKELYEPLLIFVIVPYRVKEPNLTNRARLLETFKRRLLQRDMSEISQEFAKMPNFAVMILGITKRNRLSGAKFGIPCVAVTEGTDLKPGKWMKRLVTCIHATGRKTGRMFERKLKPSKLCEYEDDFFSVLERIQSSMNTIDKELDIREEEGILRSTRRGTTAHALNMGIDQDLLKAIN
jgi:hypothetical protein